MILVVPNEIKKDYLKNKEIHNYKFYSLEELKDKLFFNYSSHILYIVSKKYDVLPSIAKKILENLYYVNKCSTKKLEFLSELKNYLEENNYLKKNPNFLNTLNDEIVIFGYPRTKELDIIINLLSKYTKVTYKELIGKYELKEIHEFLNIDLEIAFVSERILSLINEGIDINKIVVINSNSEYIGIINKTFNLFNIPFNYHIKKPLTLFKETLMFLKEIRYSSLKVSELNDILNKIKNDEIKGSIINVLNKYYKVKDEVKDLYEVIYYELKNTYLKNTYYKNVVNIYENITNFDESMYVFTISCNEEILYKDNDYLTDFEKAEIGLNESFELNEISDLYKLNILRNIKNLTLSYKLNHNDNNYIINPIFENLEIKKYEFLYNSTNYNKYLFENNSLFDNNYTKIDFDDLKTYLNNSLNLSYSSVDVFFKCKFRFFLNNILKIEPNIDTMDLKVGNMFHEILEKVLKNDFKDYLEIINEVSISYLNGDLKEKFYKEKLKKEIIKEIEYLKKINNKTEFKNTYFEKYLEIKLESNLNIKLVGFIDKILTLSDDINTHVIVVDYKTGSVKIDLEKLKDGFNIQLLIYLYLIKESNLFNNPIVAGAYIDHILEDLKNYEYGKKYEETLKLEGITTNNKEILKKIDNFYDVNSFIKGIKIKKDGDFNSTAQVYSNEEFTRFLDIVDEKLKEVVTSILKCDFEINPKKYQNKDEIIGCKYCPFKEVCYMNYKNVLVLESGEKDEINS